MKTASMLFLPRRIYRLRYLHHLHPCIALCNVFRNDPVIEAAVGRAAVTGQSFDAKGFDILVSHYQVDDIFRNRGDENLVVNIQSYCAGKNRIDLYHGFSVSHLRRANIFRPAFCGFNSVECPVFFLASGYFCFFEGVIAAISIDYTRLVYIESKCTSRVIAIISTDKVTGITPCTHPCSRMFCSWHQRGI